MNEDVAFLKARIAELEDKIVDLEFVASLAATSPAALEWAWEKCKQMKEQAK